MKTRRSLGRMAAALAAAGALLALGACGGGGAGAPAASGTAAPRSAALVGALLDAPAPAAGRVLRTAASGTCAAVTVQVNDEAPFAPDVSEDCRFFVASLPVGDVTVTVAVDGVEGTVFLPDLKDGEVVELEVQAKEDGGKVTLRIGVVRWLEDDTPDLLPAVVNGDGVRIDLPPGLYDQTLTVNGDDFTLVGTEAPAECAGEGWPTITGAVLLKGDRAFVDRVKFLSLVTVQGHDVTIGPDVCLEKGLLVVEKPVDDTAPVCRDRFAFDFEDVPGVFPGDSVEGAGWLLPLVIESHGQVALVAEGTDPEAYGAPNAPTAPSLPAKNGCLGNPGGYDADGGSVYGQGFADAAEGAPHDIAFTFAHGRTVQEFSVRMLDLGDDLGDLAGCEAARAVVKLVALGAAGETLAADAVTCGDLKAALDLALEGDACTAAAGRPGNRLLRVTGKRISRVELRFDPVVRDAKLGFDDVAFRLERKVDVDVVPTINLKSQGVIPVHLPGAACFDIDEVDASTLRFGGPAALAHGGGARPAHGAGHPEHVDLDGRMDLVLHFRTQETGIRPDDTRACLEGQTLDGGNFYGCDWIRIVPPAKDKPEKDK